DATRLWTIDVDAGSRAAIQNSLTPVPGTFDEAGSVPSIVFDQTSRTSARLIAYDAEDGRLMQVQTFNSDLVFEIGIVTLAGEPLSNLTGVALLDDDPAAADNVVYAVSGSGAESQLVSINLTTAVASVVGPL